MKFDKRVENHAPVDPNPEDPWVVRIVIRYVDRDSGEDAYRVAVGIAISSRWVLTAEHIDESINDDPNEEYAMEVYHRRTPGGRPITRPESGHFVDRINPIGMHGDLQALHLETELELLFYAPLNLYYQPRYSSGSGEHRRISPVEPDSIQGMGFGGDEGDLVNYLVVPNRFHRFEATTVDYVAAGAEMSATITPGRGSTTDGDSGGPIMFQGSVIGVISGGMPPNASVPNQVAFTLLSNSREAIQSLIPETASTSLATTGALLSLIWTSQHNEGCGWFSLLNDNSETTACLTGWRMFYQEMKDGPSWSGASSKDVNDPKARELEIPLPGDKKDALWRATVVPLINGEPQRVGKDGYPEANLPASLVGSGTSQYTMPINLKVVPQGGMTGITHVSWDAAHVASGARPAAGYQVFFQSKSSGGWSPWQSSKATDRTEGDIQLTQSSSTGPWRVVVLPYYDDPQSQKTVLVGADEKGHPFEVDATERGVLVDKPRLMGQFPTAKKTVYVTTGTVGKVALTALFNYVDPAAQGNSLIWEWSSTGQKDTFTSGSSWSALSSQNSTRLVFGTQNSPARKADSGWYRLRATNTLGTTTSDAVHVIISDQVLPQVLDQGPVSYGTVVGYTDSAEDAVIEVLFTAHPAPSHAQVMWKKLDPATKKYTPDLSKRLFSLPLQSYGKEKAHQHIATLVFGQKNIYPTEDDSGWYIAHIKTTFADKSEHEAYSLPVFVSIGAPVDLL
ncbi:trypsin-like serine protease [Xenorhabdus innexi]|uniref:Peptidase S1 domain-containing protein n=1 Tax=Xenorhabdus innexi TaxID=290109 RepID=A0A1N6MWZ7_9GAMM|nr:trypsin-like serine protease [Xenorhabdus innexi]PHM30111.1 hypothetical protein Xinn_03528 [Xenorhabdus innexi]SIP73403.1 hypothetical protein XIS1_20009 [Xenorhabdus innexi]